MVDRGEPAEAVARLLESPAPTLCSPSMELLETTGEAERLAEAYMNAEVVPAASRIDALHVALASVARADLVVSWNFKHMVQLRRIHAFHAVNLVHGYPLIDIRSPLEVSDDED